MKTKRKGAARAKTAAAKKTPKRTIRAKAGGAGFVLKVSGKVANKLVLIADQDTNFKGKNPKAYALKVLNKAAGI